MMNRVVDIVCSSIRSEVFGGELPTQKFADLSAEQWRGVFGLAAQQGVLAIVYDVVVKLPAELQPPRNLKLQWALSVDAIENRYEMQRKTSSLLANLFAENDLQTVVMKGLAMGTYYPNPAHRECGDLDCWLGDGYELGNQLCEQLGAKVSREYYKDATIRYRGLLVENHRFFLPIRGSRKMKSLERHLREVALRGEVSFVPDTKLIVPSADFNALFLTMHGLNHFLSEGVKLRHILDWALLLKAEQDRINWAEFYEWADRMHMTRYANAMTAISVDCFGLEVHNPQIVATSPYSARVLDDTLFKSEGLFNKNHSAWKKRMLLVHNKLSFGWKYHKIYQKSILLELIRSVFAFLLEKNPKL